VFVGREQELARLDQCYASDSFEMAVVYGRRRIGKTSLLTRFAHGKDVLFFTALEQADADNLRAFNARVAAFFDLPGASFASWQDAFSFVAAQAANRRFCLVFDEFPYAALRNPALVSALQIAIDHEFKSTAATLVLCGSNQGFMESNVLGRKSPLFGRRTAQIKLGPLDFIDAARMLPGLDSQARFAYYACFGGTPYYLEQVDPALSLRSNLQRLYFDPMGFLYAEPYGLLRQEFSEPALYNSILQAVASGANRPNLIADRVEIPQTSLPKYLKNLVDLGILERVAPFGQDAEKSKKARYSISEACYDFWFSFVMPRSADIEQGLGPVSFATVSDQALDEYLGHRFERVCMQWLRRKALDRSLPLPVSRIGTWWGPDKASKSQTDIDIVAGNPYEKTALLCECKYRNSFDETREVEKLLSKDGLVQDYSCAGHLLFTKYPVSAATQEKFGKDVVFVALPELYGSV
jgi:hypothetical protein